MFRAFIAFILNVLALGEEAKVSQWLRREGVREGALSKMEAQG